MSDDATVTHTVEHAEASRLPDTSWLWRRVLVYAVSVVILYVLWRVTEWLVDPTETKRAVDWGTVRLLLRYAYLTLWLVLTLYCVGASVEEVTRLVAAWKTTRKETTTTTAPPPASVSTSASGKVEVETTAKAAEPPKQALEGVPPWARAK